MHKWRRDMEDILRKTNIPTNIPIILLVWAAISQDTQQLPVFDTISAWTMLWDRSKSAWHRASAGGVHRMHGTSKQRSTLKPSEQKGSWHLAENWGRGGRVFQAGGVRSSALALLWLLRDSDINSAAPRPIGSLLPLRRREEVGRLPVWLMRRRKEECESTHAVGHGKFYQPK